MVSAKKNENRILTDYKALTFDDGRSLSTVDYCCIHSLVFSSEAIHQVRSKEVRP